MSLCGIIQDCAEHSTTIWRMIWWSRMEPLWRQNRTVPRPSPSAGEWSKIPIDTWNWDPNRSRSSKSHFKRILSIKFIYLTYRICYKNFWIKFVRHIISFFFLALMKLYSMASAQMWWSTRIQGNSSTATQYTTWPARNWPQILDVSKPN